MRSNGKAIVALIGLVPLVACGMIGGRGGAHPGRAGAASGEALPGVPMEPDNGPAPAASDAHRLIGAPYSIDGQTYTPVDVTRYDEIGYAAILWDSADGRRTASGEAYRPTAIAAAHRTLPLPSYVEVTSIDTGKTIVVRVNDRGPMLNDRIIALTPAAAHQLGIATDGTAGVRVRLVNPLEQERAILRAGGQVPERLDMPPGLRTALARRLPPAPAPLTGPVRTASAPAAAAPTAIPPAPIPPAPAPASTPAPEPAPSVRTVEVPPAVPQVQLAAPMPETPTEAPPPVRTAPASPPPAQPEVRIAQVRHTGPAAPAAPAPAPTPETPAPPAASRTGGFVVQIAALSSRARADALARGVNGYVMPAGALFRVRTGPYPSEAAARAALRTIHAKGYAEARVMINDAH